MFSGNIVLEFLKNLLVLQLMIEYSEVVHLAQAISVRDFRDQVIRQCPEGTPIPSLE